LAALWLRRFELDVFSQIGLLMVIGLAAKNAILIVEFAKVAYEGGMSLVDAALEGVRVRRRALFMTSFAFILGCVPLWTAAGAGGGCGGVGTAVSGTGVDRREADRPAHRQSLLLVGLLCRGALRRAGAACPPAGLCAGGDFGRGRRRAFGGWIAPVRPRAYVW